MPKIFHFKGNKIGNIRRSGYPVPLFLSGAPYAPVRSGALTQGAAPLPTGLAETRTKTLWFGAGWISGIVINITNFVRYWPVGGRADGR